MKTPPKTKAAPGTKTEAAQKAIMKLHDNPQLSAMQSPRLLPEACPKFQACNAPICPLDIDWYKRQHFSGDKCCMYLLESAKPHAKGIFSVAGKGMLYESIKAVTQDIIARHSAIRIAYERAKHSGSRMARKVGGEV